MNSLKKTARKVGLLWFLGSATAGFSLVYVRPKLIVPGDAAATVNNILTFESLFRAGIVSMILSQILLLFFGLAIFRIFKGVNKTLATGCFASLLVGGGVGIVNSLNNLGALILVTNPDYTKAFQPEQVNALAMTFLRMNNFGVGLVEIFTAIFLFCLELLTLKSKYTSGPHEALRWSPPLISGPTPRGIVNLLHQRLGSGRTEEALVLRVGNRNGALLEK